MGRPETRQASKEGACVYPTDNDAGAKNESTTHDLEDRDTKEGSLGSEQIVSDEEVMKETSPVHQNQRSAAKSKVHCE